MSFRGQTVDKHSQFHKIPRPLIPLYGILVLAMMQLQWFQMKFTIIEYCHYFAVMIFPSLKSCYKFIVNILSSPTSERLLFLLILSDSIFGKNRLSDWSRPPPCLDEYVAGHLFFNIT